MVHGALEFIEKNKWYMVLWNLSKRINDTWCFGIYRKEYELNFAVAFMRWDNCFYVAEEL
jgi:hypothetical protein